MSEDMIDGVCAYFFRAVKSDCNGKGERQWAGSKNIRSTPNVLKN